MLNSIVSKYINIHLSNKVNNSLNKNDYSRFDLAEGGFQVSKKIKEIIKKIDSSIINDLPDKNSTLLKSKISQYLKVNTCNISVFSGSDEIIELIPRMYLSANDNALVVAPTFSRLINTNFKVGAKVCLHYLLEKDNFNFSDINLKQVNTSIKKEDIKVVWLCSPNNPIGNIIDIKYIYKMASENKKVLFVVDEVHQEFYSLDAGKSSASLINKCNNLIVIRSFSKAFGLAGLRIGYLVSNKDIVNEIEKFRTMFNVSSIAQVLSSAVLDDIGHVKRTVNSVSASRDKIFKLIKRSRNLISSLNSNTNLIILKHKKIDSWKGLVSLNALSTNLESTPGLENLNYVRLCLGNKNHNQKLFNILKKLDKI